MDGRPLAVCYDAPIRPIQPWVGSMSTGDGLDQPLGKKRQVLRKSSPVTTY